MWCSVYRKKSLDQREKHNQPFGTLPFNDNSCPENQTAKESGEDLHLNSYGKEKCLGGPIKDTSRSI